MLDCCVYGEFGHERYSYRPHQASRIFFFKQKTAYEIGLGIPAEPLFRSKHITLKAASGGIQGDVLATDNNTVGMGDAGIKSAIQGSNEIGRASCRERV